MKPIELVSNKLDLNANTNSSTDVGDAFYQHLLSCLTINHQIKLCSGDRDGLNLDSHTNNRQHPEDESMVTEIATQISVAGDYDINLNKTLLESNVNSTRFEIGLYKGFGFRIA